MTDEVIKALQGIVMAVSAGRVRAQFNEVHARFIKKKKRPADAGKKNRVT
jgi:hypothetical protein